MSIFDGQLKISVAAASGIEAITKRELKSLGYGDVPSYFGRMNFIGSMEDVARCNVFLRTASKVRIILAEFKAETFDELFDGIYSVDFGEIHTEGITGITPEDFQYARAMGRTIKLLAVSRDNDLTHRAGREKRFVLTEKGKEYAGPLLDSLTRIERQAVERIGREHLRAMADSVLTYSAALQAAMEEDT